LSAAGKLQDSTNGLLAYAMQDGREKMCEYIDRTGELPYKDMAKEMIRRSALLQ
jgi:hypothetical protein